MRTATLLRINSCLAGKYFYGIALLVVLASAYTFRSTSEMSPVFTVPFFSGAANFQPGAGWRYAVEEVFRYDALSPEARGHYRFRKFPGAALVPYSHNNPGLLYNILVAKSLFFWLGDVNALKCYQVLVHLLVCGVALALLRKPWHRGLFLLAYAANPLVIYFVTFPFYYFWQVLPSLAIVVLLGYRKKLHPAAVALLAAGMALALVTRPTVVFAVGCGFGLLLRTGWRNVAVAGATFALVTLVLYAPASNKTVWHTIYVGVGAYPNPYMQGLSDNNGFDLFRSRTGIALSISPGGNFHEPVLFKRYEALLRDEYLVMLRQSPLLLVRNACLNFGQAFSAGYFVDYPRWVSYVSAAFGLVFCLLLVRYRLFWWAIAIAATTLSFFPYFPPIQAYMFGSYLLLVMAFIALLEKINQTP